MTHRFARLAWTAAAFTYALIPLGAVVRITGSGLGCGEHWPLCNGRLLPPLDVPTLIEYGHRLAAAAVAGLVVAVAGYAAWLRRSAAVAGPQDSGPPPGLAIPPAGSSLAAYAALGLLALQVALGAVTVKLSLPPWTVILHLGTAMLLLAALIAAARGAPPGVPSARSLGALALGFATVLLGALTANLGAASACLGFPLCNGHLMPAGNYLQHIQWTHRVLAFLLLAYVAWWASASRRAAVWAVLGLLVLQVGVAAGMVLLALPAVLQAAHVAFGAAIWAGLVIAAE